MQQERSYEVRAAVLDALLITSPSVLSRLVHMGGFLAVRACICRLPSLSCTDLRVDDRCSTVHGSFLALGVPHWTGRCMMQYSPSYYCVAGARLLSG